MAGTPPLTREDLGFLAHARRILTAPDWSGFHAPRAESMNYGRRYQVAFLAWAMAAQARRVPAYRGEYGDLLRACVERLRDRVVWEYWGAGGGKGAERVRQTRAVDPVASDNAMYSGHLATTLGLHERLTGDDRYDADFSLVWDDETRFTWTHHAIAQRIHEQMRDQPFHAVCCEPGHVYPQCNNHTAISNVLHDRLHGTDYASVNPLWYETLEKELMPRHRLPWERGSFRVAYLPETRMTVPVTLNFTDAWALAFLSAHNRPLAEQHYDDLRRRLAKTTVSLYDAQSPQNVQTSHVPIQTSDFTLQTSHCLPAAPGSDQMEVANTGLNTAFMYVLAREMGDQETAAALRAWLDAALELAWRDDALAYRAAKPVAYVTALVALGAALTPGGLADLVQSPVVPPLRPFLRHVTNAGVLAADVAAGGALSLRLLPSGDGPVTLTCAGFAAAPRVMSEAAVERMKCLPEEEVMVALQAAGDAEIVVRLVADV